MAEVERLPVVRRGTKEEVLRVATQSNGHMLGINYELQYRSGPREETGEMEVIGQLATGQQWPPCHTGSTCLHFRFRALCQLAGKHTHAHPGTQTHTHTQATYSSIFSHSNKAINCYYIEKFTRTHATLHIHT